MMKTTTNNDATPAELTAAEPITLERAPSSAPERMACAVGRVIDLVDAARDGAPQRMTMLRRAPAPAAAATIAPTRGRTT